MQKPFLLIYEDDPSQQKLYTLIAPKLGWDCVVVGTCKEAAQAVKYAFFDALVMSLDKNEMKDFKCLSLVNEITARQNYYLPVLAATAFAMPEEIERTRQAGIDDHLAKPFTIEEFKRRIIRLITYVGKRIRFNRIKE